MLTRNCSHRADVAVKYLTTKDASALPKILQFSSEDKFTKYEICQLFADIMGLSIDTITPQRRGQRSEGGRTAAVRLPPQHQGAQGPRHRCLGAEF